MTLFSWQIPCDRCGHPEGDHPSTVPVSPLYPVTYGKCRWCECPGFVSPQEKAV